MKVVKHHRFRLTSGITWRGEYLMGIIQEEGECKTSYLRHLAGSHDIIDILVKLERDGFVQVRRPNNKLRLHSLTDLGTEYLQQVEGIYAR